MDSGFNMLGQFQGDSSLGMGPSHQAQSPAFPSIGSAGPKISLVQYHPEYLSEESVRTYDVGNFFGTEVKGWLAYEEKRGDAAIEAEGKEPA